MCLRRTESRGQYRLGSAASQPRVIPAVAIASIDASCADPSSSVNRFVRSGANPNARAMNDAI